MRRPAWVLALLVTVGAAPSAQARVVKAEGILPPGQSGFVSLPGVLTGSGSEHLYDQQPLFIRFQRKPLMFGQKGTPTEPRAGVKIVRDAFGVPAVTGASEYDMWWGAGYAVAQDRLFELELFRRATTGRLAEILGRSYLDDDLIARRDYYTPAELDAMASAVPKDLLARVEAYRDGVNAHIAEVRLNPVLMPGEFPALGALPIQDWTVRDSTAIGIFLARTVPSGDGNELTNLRVLQEAGAKALDALLPIRIKGQISTIPESEGRFPQGRQPSARAQRKAFGRSVAFAATLPKPSEAAARAATRKADLAPGMIGRRGGSYMFAIGDRKAKRAWLFNGPQLGFAVPELFVELELHAPGIDLRGVTAPGIPLIGIGHNGHVAWGLTSGLSDEDDLYAEKLVEGQPEKYVFQGQERQMECRDEVFSYQSPITDLIGGAVPEPPGSVTERICRTVHGPVQVREGGVAYARRYAIWGRELETIVGIAKVNAAKTVADVAAAVRELTWNENLMAADGDGNIGYWHPGLVQLRPSGWDQRLPMPGTGEAEWGGLVDRAKMPHVVNPDQGWVSNWNNIPSQGWTTGDGEATERVTGWLHRNQALARMVRRLARNPSFDGAERVIRRVGAAAQQRLVLGPRLRRVARRASGDAKVVLDTVLRWDGDYHRTDEAGTTDPGVAAWVAFREAARDLAIAPFGKPAERLGFGTSSSHVFDFSNTMSYALRTLSDAQLRAAAATAFGKLKEKFSTDQPARWREPRRMYAVTAQGAGSAPPLPFFDRGTWEQIIELGR